MLQISNRLLIKSLESDELAYLFGVRESVLSEPRNGITLRSVIEGGLDEGWIVLVPDKPKEGKETVWRCVLVDESKASHMIHPGTRWKNIDGKELKFPTPNRPARRYLYLRYVITLLQQQKLGNTKWLDRIQSKAISGLLWDLTREKSMLLALARRVSDHYLPEVFYESTFTAAEGCPEESPDIDTDLAMAFDHILQDVRAEERYNSDDEEEEEEEEEEEDD
ncbi:hypothetical protein F5884DRAFT_756171 [Xylogone sp. PMI_703]|nr:hypothetical protein F5884DRAFT_756171 [Xylogone sp. PMI_703]